VFVSAVSLISSIVLIYSTSYILGDKNIQRFIWLVGLFVLSIIFMILSPNLISILLGWDGLGLVSYALVIYYQNVKSANAGIITVLSNRVGDVAILICVSWLFRRGGWDFLTLNIIPHLKINDISWIIMLLVLASITKRAQIPFSAWLPAAMAAPTPVSSLVHSSTLVTAGVYLLIRFRDVIGVNLILMLVAIITLFISGLGANFEFDLKKIIALSTLSQLGVIIFVLSLGLYELAYFHLISHAIFKSLLFLCAGAYIHSLQDCQDIRNVRIVFLNYPIVRVCFVACSLSLSGFPFLAGFYSKDLILDTYVSVYIGWLTYIILILGTLITFIYSIRLVFYIYLKGGLKSKLNIIIYEAFLLMPIIVLFIISTIIGVLFTWLFINPIAICLPYFIKLIVFSLIIRLGAIWLFGAINMNPVEGLKNYQKNISIFWLRGHIWFIYFMSSINFQIRLKPGRKFQDKIDQGWLEAVGAQGAGNSLIDLASLIDKWSLLNFKSYSYILFLLIIVFLAFCFSSSYKSIVLKILRNLQGLKQSLYLKFNLNSLRWKSNVLHKL